MTNIPTAILLAGLVTAAPADVTGIALRDQHGGSDSVSAHHGEVVIAMVVTAGRLRNLKGWERDLRERYDDLHFLRIADVPKDPPVTYDDVAEKLAKRVPKELEVLIDMNREWAAALDLDTDRPNLLLFDRGGILVGRTRGRAKPELVERLAAQIEKVMGTP